MRVVVVAALVLGLAGCTTYRDQLGRSERAFEQHDHDRTLAILRDLEPDFARLTTAEQANYAYVRGMTDYSVGYKADARHWLSVANGYEAVTPNVLTSDRKTKAAETLKELSAGVYNDGNTANLVNARREDPAAPKAEAGKGKAEKADKPEKAEPAAPSKKAPPQKPAAKPDDAPSDE